MKVAPVYAQVVARPIKNALVLGTCCQHRERTRARTAPDDLLIRRIDSKNGIGIQIDGNFMPFPIDRS